jgi:short-subunit dehydrogenase
MEYRAIEADLSEDGFFERVAEATKDLDVGLFVGNAGFASPGELWTIDRKELLRAIHLKDNANLMLVHHRSTVTPPRGVSAA